MPFLCSKNGLCKYNDSEKYCRIAAWQWQTLCSTILLKGTNHIMKFTLDRKLIDSLNDLSDERLWHMFCMLMSGAGVDMGRKKYDPKRICGIRALLSAVTDEDICRINELIELYNSHKK